MKMAGKTNKISIESKIYLKLNIDFENKYFFKQFAFGLLIHYLLKFR